MFFLLKPISSLITSITFQNCPGVEEIVKTVWGCSKIDFREISKDFAPVQIEKISGTCGEKATNLLDMKQWIK